MFPLVAALLAASTSAPSKPHILFILVDDLGYAELGFHLEKPDKEVQTPIIDGLVADGVDLQRHYVHKFCSPTRCAIQSGRAPIHVNVINAAPEVYNPADPISGFAGIPRNMTGIAEVMAKAGYRTHFAGKWDAGMATPQHTPAGRGYHTSLGYFHHANDYWTQKDGGKCNGTEIIDLWNLETASQDGFYGRPAIYKRNGPDCTENNQNPNGQTCVYEDTLFESRITQVIENHPIDEPLFAFWSTHIVHGPLEVPDAQLAKFSSFISFKQRALYRSMVNWIDGAIGRVVQKTKDKGLYDNLLIVFSADNGGPISGGATNFPLRGGKFSNWEGGIRVSAFVSGGFLPAAVRGTKQSGLVAGWDWYATFAGLAGVDPTDARAARAGLPPIDSVDLWPLLSGKNKTSPRNELQIGSNLGGDDANRTSGPTRVGGIIQPPWKILVGYGFNNTIDMAGWSGLNSPNGTGQFATMKQACGRTPQTGCLYNVWDDPQEHHNVAAENVDIYNRMLARLDEVESTVFSPDRGTDGADKLACSKALNKYNGYWGPFIE